MKTKYDLYLYLYLYLYLPQFRHKSIVVHHSLFLYSLQWYVAQQHTEGIVAFPLQQWLREVVKFYVVRM